MRKRFFTLLAISLVFSSSAHAASITGIRSLNNDQRTMDYKVSEDSFSKMYDSVQVNSQSKEKIPSSPERGMGDLIIPKIPTTIKGSTGSELSASNFDPIVSPIQEQQLSWLINNNIVSRETEIVADNSGVNAMRKEVLYDENDPLSNLGKTEFLVGMYKSVFGPIESRPVAIKTSSVRSAEKQVIKSVVDSEGKPQQVIEYEPLQDQTVSGTGSSYRYTPYGSTDKQIFSFDEGDYSLVVSPNVPELYLKELVTKGIIPLASIANVQFQKDYSLLGTEKDGGGSKIYPRWYPNLSPFMASSGADQSSNLSSSSENSKVWGDSFSIKGQDGKDISSDERGFIQGQVTISTQPSTSKYFTDEVISTISALKYVESLVRLTEKDMTDTEATIVTYKYGASYLSDLEEEDRKTVMFLTAKGILNFEDETEYKGLYSTLTKSMAYKLMYRVANKNARLDFSQIQLTDSDNFWINKGFGQVNLNLNYLNESEYGAYKNDDGSYKFSALPDVQTLNVSEKSLSASTVEKKKKFFGITFFTRKSSFADSGTSQKEYTISKVFDQAQKYQYRGVSLTDTTNLKKAEWVTSVDTDTKGKVTVKFTLKANSVYVALGAIDSNISIGTKFLFKTSGVSAVSKYDVDGKEVTLVPESIFRDNGPELGQKISVLSDKVIKNLETGNTAILLQDSNIALIGTHIIYSKELMVTSLNGEKYYNMEIIRYLLSNVYISSLDPHSIYFSSGQTMERLASVVATTGSTVGKTYIAKFNAPEFSDELSTLGKFKFSNFVNISQLTGVGNFLIRNFEVLDRNKQKMSFTVIMQLTYSLPNKNDNFLNPLYKKSNPTFSDINDFIFKRPEDKELADWWDNNYYLSNSVANVFYGTKGVEYVKSGYLSPSLTILYNSPGVIQEKHLHKFLQDVGTQLPASWVERFIGDTKEYNQPTTIGTDVNNKDSKYYPEKFLTPNSFPKWVHAMFNNSYTNSAMEGYSGSTASGKSNTELWRHLMEVRKFSALSGVSYGDNSKLYMSGTTAYVETNSGAIFTKISEEDTRFPSKLVVDSKVVEDTDLWTKGKEFVFKPQTRTDVISNEDWTGKRVTDSAGNSYYLTNTSGGFFYLTDTAAIEGMPHSTKRGTKDFYEIQGTITKPGGSVSSPYKNAIQTRFNQLFKQFTDPGLSGYSKAAASWTSAGTVTSIPKSDIVKGKTLYLDLGFQKLIKDKTKTFYTVGTPNYKTLSEIKSTVTAYVSIQLDSNYWAINQSGEIFARKTFPQLQVGNIYFSGINQGVMDSIIYKSVGVTSLSDIKSGASLLIGDIKFTKRGDYFVSSPQTNLTAWKDVLSDAENKNKVKNAVFNSLAGMAVSSSGRKTVNASQVPVPLINFVTDQGLAQPETETNKITLLGGGSVPNKAYVYKFKDGKFTLGNYEKGNPPSVSGIVFYLKFDNNLVARKLDSDNRSYQLMLSTSSLSDGFLSDVPFFNEDLNLNPAEDLSLIASKTNFKIPNSAQDARDKFQALFHETFLGNIQSAVQLIIVSVFSYLLVITWAVFTLLRMPLIYGVLDLLRNPSRDSRRSGIDLVRLFSLGIYNLESSLSFSKLILGSVIMTLIINLVLSFHTGV